MLVQVLKLKLVKLQYNLCFDKSWSNKAAQTKQTLFYCHSWLTWLTYVSWAVFISVFGIKHLPLGFCRSKCCCISTASYGHYYNEVIRSEKSQLKVASFCHFKVWPQTLFKDHRLCLFPLLPLIKQDFVEPIYFYIGAVLGLQAVYVTALFVCSWVMSGTWVAGMLAVAWYVINR